MLRILTFFAWFSTFRRKDSSLSFSIASKIEIAMQCVPYVHTDRYNDEWRKSGVWFVFISVDKTSEISKKLCCFACLLVLKTCDNYNRKLWNEHTIETLTIYSSDSVSIFCLLLCVETFIHFIGFLIYYRWSLSRLLFKWRTHIQLYFVEPKQQHEMNIGIK